MAERYVICDSQPIALPVAPIITDAEWPHCEQVKMIKISTRHFDSEAQFAIQGLLRFYYHTICFIRIIQDRQVRHQRYETLSSYEKVSESKKSKDLWFKAWALTSICDIDAQVFKAWRDEDRSFCDIFCNRFSRFLESQHRSCSHCNENSQRNSILASLLEDEAWFCEPDDLPGDSVTGELSCVGGGTTTMPTLKLRKGGGD